MFIHKDKHLLGLSSGDMKIISQALYRWKGPYGYENGPRTPAEEDYQKEKLDRAEEIRNELISTGVFLD